MKIVPKCLAFNTRDNKGAAYTSDGFMLPCCWMDDPPVYRHVKACGLKDEELLLSNNERLEDIFTSDQWENFFQTLLNDPKNASYMCKKKCGVDIDVDAVKAEERFEVRGQANGKDY
jgi:hypothetical protein|tara:strand:- start:829 stop:1179 length:351 start_codon:yes stop_codon:yes gene_type:complete